MVLAFAAISGIQEARADEGMWMINAIDAALEKKMQERGLELAAGEIYNADAPGATIADAVVSMEFGCTGSIISDEGLLITNHHCAYGDVHKLSDDEHNYLEDGFWALRSDEEVNIKGKSVLFLKRVLDVTEEVEALKQEQKRIGKPAGMRRISYLMEKKYKEETGLEAILSSMWSGSKYYLALYSVYSDVRLVAAPPVSSAAFGGDIDNWEWPQHKCDFALYRVYTAPDGSPAAYSEENIPMKSAAKLKISLDGYKEGDYTMVIGYPGRTNRYSSSFETGADVGMKLPVSNDLRGRQMDIIKGWMDKDPQIRLRYSDYFFSLSNVQELYSGQVECIRRYNVLDSQRLVEKELQKWIDASEERSGKWGSLLSDMQGKYSAVEDAERNIVYLRETLIRGTRFGRAVSKVGNFRNEILIRNGITPKKLSQLQNGPDPVEENCCNTHIFSGDTLGALKESLLKEYANFDLRVEKELFRLAVEEYLENVDTDMLGEWQAEMKTRYNGDYKALADDLWENSFLTDIKRRDAFLADGHTIAEYFADPVVHFFRDSQILDFNKAILDIEGEVRRIDLEREFVHALYQMRLDKGIAQYPDANSTMRLTYGTVSGLKPRDGVICDWKTTPAGILEKYNPADYDFHLDDRQYLLYRKGDWGRWGIPDGNGGSGMYVNFLTDNDITGGNSGSPVLNSRGELIGLAFDGNKESLASDVWFHDDCNKCVCVDIRFILWTLDRYAGMSRILDELGL